jgi:hypothetical protein
VLRAVLPLVLLTLPACARDLEAILDEVDALPHASESSSDTSSGESTGDGPASSDGEATSTDGGETADSTGSVGDASSTEAASSGGEAVLPEVLAIELPGEVHAAGPVPITVHTRNTATVRVKLDGIDVGELAASDEGVFVGELVVKGAVDNGTRHVEVIAALGEHEDREEVTFEVDVAEAGKPAWSMPGPLGTRTNRIALTADGDVLEGGIHIGADIPRPAVRKRSGSDGADLWGKKVLLSPLEGHVADLAVAPDGRIWVAMNVKEVSQKWWPHILLLEPDGTPTGVDRPGAPGHTLRAIAADDDGGCFGVGFALAEGGDLDVVYQGVNAAGQGTVTDTWDYKPEGAFDHSFADAAADVVIDGDIAWVAGLSVGKHDIDQFNVSMRGMIAPFNIHTGELVGPVIVAPAADPWWQSMFFGLALDSEGIVVTGAGCQDACGGLQRIETSRYLPGGVRTWHQFESSAVGAHGSDVVIDSQGRAIVAAASEQGSVLRGHAFARTVGEIGLDPLWEHWFPVSQEPSEALGAARDKYDRIFIAGYVTAGGSPQAWLVKLGQ